MSFFVGVDVSKEKFDVCCIDEQEDKIFSLTCSMDRGGFEKLILHLPAEKRTPIPRVEAKAIDATPSSIALIKRVVAFPVVPSWIAPTTTIAPVQ